MESNDSPEIPDRGETSDIPGLPSGEREREGEGERERELTFFGFLGDASVDCSGLDWMT